MPERDDINAKLATDVMGWVMHYPLSDPPEWVLPDGKTKSLTGTVMHLVADWSPMGDIRHAAEVLMKVHTGGFEWFIESCPEGTHVVVSPEDDSTDCSEATGPVLTENICNAVIAALASVPDQPNTVRVRIPVALNSNGHWYAVGSHAVPEAESVRDVAYGIDRIDQQVVIVTATLPIPQPPKPAEVEGAVEETDA